MKIGRTRKSGRQQERKITNENPGDMIKNRRKMKIKKHEDQERE